jgi:hypothetical protein
VRCGGAGTVVTIAGGVYAGDGNMLRLSDADSGCPSAPVVYRAAPADPVPVRLHAGAQVPPSAFSSGGSAPGGGEVWRADLKPLGLAELARTTDRFNTGWVCANGNRTEVFMDGIALTLARHPNKLRDKNLAVFAARGGAQQDVICRRDGR